MGAFPSDSALKAWARRSPDRFAQAVAIFARLTGYKDTKRVEHSGLVAIAHMSDSQIEAKLQELEAQVIEGEFTPVP